MPSGKKARGRRNRAKKEATRTADLRSLWEPLILLDNNSKSVASPCEQHMLAVIPRIPKDGPVVCFMNHFAEIGLFCTATPVAGNPLALIFETLSCFPDVVVDDCERSLATNLLLRYVRNAFLLDYKVEGEDWFHQHHKNKAIICSMAGALEIYGTYSDQTVKERRTANITNRLWGGNGRDTVKFVAKRLQCTCLKKLHKATRKKLGKVGVCIGCQKQFPRSQLYVCTGCMYAEYCSGECQRATWSTHKEQCGCPEVMSRDLPRDYVVRRNDRILPISLQRTMN